MITNADGSKTVRSGDLFRAVVPGQVAWDNAQSSWANGDKVGAVVNTAAGVGEQVVTVLSAGASRSVSAASSSVAGTTSAKAANVVYQSVSASGEVNYVGITNNLQRRAGEHLAAKGISIDAIPGLGNLSRADARAVEQALIQQHGLGRNGGTLMNMINSIATKNPSFGAALARGADLLHNAGYPGF